MILSFANAGNQKKDTAMEVLSEFISYQVVRRLFVDGIKKTKEAVSTKSLSKYSCEESG